MTRLPDFTIAVPAVLLAAACASTADSVDEPSSGKVDRTGSSLPAKDYGAANVEVASPDVINPVNRPMPSVLSTKPGGCRRCA